MRLLLILALVLVACEISRAPEGTSAPTPEGVSAEPSGVAAPAASEPPTPVGRAASVAEGTPAPGMVRLQGRTLTSSGVPILRLCVTLGPPIRCAVLTDDDGRWIIDIPQGKIAWELHFLREGMDVQQMYLWGPFPQEELNPISVVIPSPTPPPARRTRASPRLE